MIHQPPQPADNVEAVLERYGNMLYRLCVILLKNEADAEDALQETMIRYCQKRPVFADSEHQKAWLIRVATNQCRDLLRYRQRHPNVDDEFLSKLSRESPDSGILEALTSLPEKYRLVLTLHYIEGYRTGEIAQIIRRSPSAVKMRLQKGRKMLETIYREEYL